MRTPTIGDIVVAYIRDDKQIGSPIICVPMIVTDCAKVKDDRDQTLIFAGGVALFGPALCDGPQPVMTAQDGAGRPLRMPAAMQIGPLPYSNVPRPQCWTFVAQHPGGHMLRPANEAKPVQAGALSGVGVDPFELPEEDCSDDNPGS